SGHIPMLFGAPADSALVIGYASGVTAGAVSLYRPSTLDLVEIEPAVVEASHFFEPQNLKPLSYEKSRLILDDGRTYLTSTETKYDVVISEPSNPFLSGCSNLFTRDFFRSVRSHLNPGGRLFQWLQLYGMDPAGLSSLMAAITDEFPYVYAFHYESGNVDLLLYATDRPLRREDLPQWAHLPDPVRDDLRRVSIFSTADLWSLLRLLPSDISEIARAATEINTDDSMFIELHAPWVLHESPEANLALLARFQQGVLGVAEAPGAEHLSAEQLGELAFAYALPRGEAAIGRRLAEEADRRGGSASAMVMRSELAQRESQQQPAVTLGTLDEAVNLDPAAFWPRFHRGRLHYFLARYAEALSDADELAARYPHDTRGLQLRLRTLGALGRFQDAAKQAETLLASPRGQFEKRIWADAAVALAAVGQLEQGIAQMERFLAAQPFSPNEWNVLAEMYRQSGRAQDAERARANAGISERNQLLLAHRSARWEARFGSRDRAAALLKSILERDPAYVAAREDLESLVRRTATGS
ncbi:MAG: hypothetical protein KA745_11800, partial [Gemmatimonadales bacterium]|nr:hypothetical protein [Gemmatimonadales bacterium]